MKPSLGKFTAGGIATVDLPRLLETRLLIQAGSGFGKSWLCRRLLEQTAGRVQQFVIDPEGEFATLREKHDYVIAAAHDGDALAHPRTAQLLVRRLLETGVSAILDIYDLKMHERHAFVRTFCDSLVNAPKALWQPVLVLLDEAHVFCPEGAKSESASAVIDLATRGRKRGFGLVLATQRLSKLNKDAAAESFNKLIGRCELDVDVKRAAAELGTTPKDALDAFRKFEPGDFFAFGPALSPTVERMHVGGVETTHPKAGQRSLRAPPKPTAAIKAVLPKLADLPKEAEAESRSIEDLRRELSNTRRELTQAKNAKPGASREEVQAAEIRGFDRGKQSGQQEAERASAAQLKSLRGALHQAVESAIAGLPPPTAQKATPFIPKNIPVPPRAKAVEHPRGNGHAEPSIGAGGKRRILTALAQYPEGMDHRKLSILVDLSPRSGTWSTYIGDLRSKGWVDGREHLKITDAGREALGEWEPLPTGAELVEYWRHRLGKSGKRAIFDVVVAAYPNAVNVDDVADQTGLSSHSGTWSTYLGELRSLGLIEGRGELRASETLF